MDDWKVTCNSERVEDFTTDVPSCTETLLAICSRLILLTSQFSSAMSSAFSLSLCSNFASLASFSSIACLSLAFSALTLAFSALISVFSARSSTTRCFNESSSDCMFDNNFHIGCDLFKMHFTQVGLQVSLFLFTTRLHIP